MKVAMAVDTISGTTSYSVPTKNASTNTSTTVAAKPVTPVEKADVADSSTKVAAKPEELVGIDNNRNDALIPADAPITEGKMKKAIDDINRSLQDKTCEFGFDEVTNRVTIKIIDKETDEVIRELPPEKTLRMIAKAWELAGILVDEKL